MIYNQPHNDIINTDDTISNVVYGKISDFKENGTINATNDGNNVSYIDSANANAPNDGQSIYKYNAKSKVQSSSKQNADSKKKLNYKLDTQTNPLKSHDSDKTIQEDKGESSSQDDDTYVYQINYEDGNSRLYDAESGELIGSTFSSDQGKVSIIHG